MNTNKNVEYFAMLNEETQTKALRSIGFNVGTIGSTVHTNGNGVANIARKRGRSVTKSTRNVGPIDAKVLGRVYDVFKPGVALQTNDVIKATRLPRSRVLLALKLIAGGKLPGKTIANHGEKRYSFWALDLETAKAASMPRKATTKPRAPRKATAKGTPRKRAAAATQPTV